MREVFIICDCCNRRYPAKSDLGNSTASLVAKFTGTGVADRHIVTWMQVCKYCQEACIMLLQEFGNKRRQDAEAYLGD